jgi:hypothetical protein
MLPYRTLRMIHEVLRHLGADRRLHGGGQCPAQHPEKFRARHDNQPIEPSGKPRTFKLTGKLSGEGLDLVLVRIMLPGGRVMGACTASAGLERCMVGAANRAVRHEVAIVQACTRIRNSPRELQALRWILQIIEKGCALICNDNPHVQNLSSTNVTDRTVSP